MSKYFAFTFVSFFLLFASVLFGTMMSGIQTKVPVWLAIIMWAIIINAVIVFSYKIYSELRRK